MKLSVRLCVVLSVLLLTGCDLSFVPYDYKKSESAKLKGKNYNLKWHSKKLEIEKEF